MSSINSIGLSPGTVQTVSTTAVNAASTPAPAMVTPAACAAPPPMGAPILLPPAGNSDHAGASAMMSAYTALIVLVCEANRENYAANRTMVEAEVHTRVNELMSAADKRRTGAIISLVLGVVGGVVGIAGGASGAVQSGKSLSKLNALGADQKTVGKTIRQMETEAARPKQESPGRVDNQQPTLADDALHTNADLESSHPASGNETVDVPVNAEGAEQHAAPVDVDGGEAAAPPITDGGDSGQVHEHAHETEGAQKPVVEPQPQDVADTPSNEQPKSVGTAAPNQPDQPNQPAQSGPSAAPGQPSEPATTVAPGQPSEPTATVAPGQPTDVQGTKPTSVSSQEATKAGTIKQSQQHINRELRVVEATTARTQSLGIMFSALKETFASAGQGAQGLMGAEADTIAARAEQTQGDIQITMSNMQQYQDLMGKFTQILSDLLEAENKARSAAAQA